MKEGKRIFALTAVALMLLVSLSVMVPAQSDATASSTVMPTMNDYAYVFKYDTSTGAITGVWQNGNITEANITGNTNKATAASTTNPGSWGFTNGLGPFNSFYAAINTSSSADSNRMNTGVGQIAFILNPNDLTKTLDNTAWTMANYNIMFVIPTVYWYSDTTNGIMYMSNTDNNPYIAAYNSSANANMFPYAHNMTATSTSGNLPTGGHTYPYLAIGVYEATLNGSLLQSKSGSTPAASTKLAPFSTYAKNNNDSLVEASVDTSLPDHKVGQYGLWNFYGWTLYKIMSETVIGSRNAQAAIGQGNAPTSNAYPWDTATATAASKAGQGNAAGPYANNVAANRGNTVYSKLFIENSWGSVWEFVDNTWVGTSTLHAGANLSPSSSGDNSMTIQGSDYTGGSMAIPTGSNTSISKQSIKSSAWGAVSTSSPSTTSSVSGDNYWSTNDATRCLFVGGSWSVGASDGLSAWSSNYVLSISYTNIGARLAYMMTADAAGNAHTVSVTTVEHGTTTTLVTSAVAGELISFENDPASGYRLKDVTITYPTSQTVTPSYKTLVRGAFTMPAGNVTITPVYEALVDLGIIAGVNGTVSIVCGDSPVNSPITVAGTSPYSVSGTKGDPSATMTVTDTILGVNKIYTVTATPSSEYLFESFKDGNSNILSTGTVGSIVGSTVTAGFFQYTWSVTTPTNGTVTASSGQIGVGKDVTLTATGTDTSNGYRLATINAWYGATAGAKTNAFEFKTISWTSDRVMSCVFTMPAGYVTIEATFEQLTTVSMSKDAQGTLTPGGVASSTTVKVGPNAVYGTKFVSSDDNTQVITITDTLLKDNARVYTRISTFTAAPNADWEWGGFINNSSVLNTGVSTAPVSTLAGSGTKTVNAHFFQYTVQATASDGHGTFTIGSTPVTTPVAQIKNSAITLTTVPSSAAQWRLAAITGTYTPYLGDTPQTLTFTSKGLESSAFTMPAGDVVITATFEEIATITKGAHENGTTAIKIGAIDQGSSVKVKLDSPFTITTTGIQGKMSISDTYLDWTTGQAQETKTRTIDIIADSTIGDATYGDYIFNRLTKDNSKTATELTSSTIDTIATSNAVTIYAWSFQYTITMAGPQSTFVDPDHDHMGVGRTVTLATNGTTSDGYRLIGFTATYTPNEDGSDPQPLEITTSSLTSNTFTMPEGYVTITPSFDLLVTLNVSYDQGGSVMIKKNGEATEDETILGSLATYSVNGRQINITDTHPEGTDTWAIIASPAAALTFGGYLDELGNELASSGTIQSIAKAQATADNVRIITATFTAGEVLYTITFIEPDDRTTVGVVKAEYTLMLPVPKSISGKSFDGWYLTRSGSGTEQDPYTYTDYVGPSGSYYKPTANTDVYASFTDIATITVTTSYKLDGTPVQNLDGKGTFTPPTSIRQDQAGYLIANPNAGYSVAIAASNADVYPMANGIYRLVPTGRDSNSDGTPDDISLIISATTGYQGINGFRIAALTDENTGALVVLEPASTGGLVAGKVHFGGVYYTESGTGASLVRAYGAITDTSLKIGSTALTSDGITVTEGSQSLNKTVVLKTTGQEIYSIYAYYVYTLGTGENTVTTPAMNGEVVPLTLS